MRRQVARGLLRGRPRGGRRHLVETHGVPVVVALAAGGSRRALGAQHAARPRGDLAERPGLLPSRGAADADPVGVLGRRQRRWRGGGGGQEVMVVEAAAVVRGRGPLARGGPGAAVVAVVGDVAAAAAGGGGGGAGRDRG